MILEPTVSGNWHSKLALLGLLVPVAGGRWGSHLGIGGLFLSDALVATGLLFYGSETLRGKSSPSKVAIEPGAWRNLRFASALVGVAALIGGLRVGALDRDSVRDVAPFVYLALTPVFCRCISNAGLARATGWIGYASMVHLAWYLPTRVGVLNEVAIPAISDVPIFSIRNDFDAVVTAFAGVWILMWSRVGLVGRTLVAAVCAALVVSGPSRAGLVGGAVLLVGTCVLKRPLRHRMHGHLVATAAFCAGAVTATYLALRGSLPGWAVSAGRLAGTGNDLSASSTTSARVEAWRQIWIYTNERDLRIALGDGFGSDVVRDSGAQALLSGSETVRQAHNVLFTWLGLVGLIGVSLVAVGVAIMCLVSFRGGRGSSRQAVTAALPVSLLATSLIGVVLESPFGYQVFVLSVVLSCCDEAWPPLRSRWAPAEFGLATADRGGQG
ncbi:hypothetical protein BDK89_4121 [Ilumatobacter fluminis]|uniref:O-antigen ligase-like membrane protein n=1 Tax=Ilumatobacter fluminis TaxID=467091 RepID=A0A4R7I577_9ACTN|nr:hypothetical protein [Ilumatobacter fluminis]TDT18500.1 hypothetical protein BDK89_4121 [Ilumatobacter fluminis]